MEAASPPRRRPSSALVGMYSCDPRMAALRPIFNQIYSDVPDGDISTVVREGKDILLTRLADGKRWHLRDCRNGVLLLRRDAKSLCVYNPVSGGEKYVTIEVEGEFVADCLLQGTMTQCVAVDTFRVVSVQVQVQQRGRQGMVRAVVYDSSTSEWHCHQWTSLPPDGGSLSIHPQWDMPMYAAGRIFWEYATTFLYVLDTRTMEFSSRPFPSKWPQPDFRYSIGEIPNTLATDNIGYLVCIRGLLGKNQNPMLEVWSLDASDNIDASDNMLKLKIWKKFPMGQLNVPFQVCSVCTVINGLAVMTYRNGPHFVVDLQKETLLANFKFSGRGYLYQLSQKPAISLGSTPPLQDNNIPCSQNQYVDATNGNEGSSNEVAPCENHHTLKSADTPKVDGPRERKKQRMRYANKELLLAYKKLKSLKRKRRKTNPLGETTMGHQDPQMPSLSRRTRSSHAVHDMSVEAAATSTSAARQISPQRKSKRGRLVTDIPCIFDSCGKKFNTLYGLKSHVKIMHSSKNKRSNCLFKGCTQVFRNKHDRNCHMKSIHVEVGTKKYICHVKGCMSTFGKIPGANSHFKTAHLNKRFQCTLCEKTLCSKASLDGHVKTWHTSNGKHFACRFKGCPKFFRTKYEMSSHEESIAHVEWIGEVKWIKCCSEGCLTTFAQRNFHNTHYQSHH